MTNRVVVTGTGTTALNVATAIAEHHYKVITGDHDNTRTLTEITPEPVPMEFIVRAVPGVTEEVTLKDNHKRRHRKKGRNRRRW